MIINRELLLLLMFLNFGFLEEREKTTVLLSNTFYLPDYTRVLICYRPRTNYFQTFLAFRVQSARRKVREVDVGHYNPEGLRISGSQTSVNETISRNHLCRHQPFCRNVCLVWSVTRSMLCKKINVLFAPRASKCCDIIYYGIFGTKNQRSKIMCNL